MKLKLLLLLLIFFSCNKPKLHYIKFIHVGIEEKPIGTIAISVEEPVYPRDKPSDDFFGRALQTDMRTFEIMEAFIKREKHFTDKRSENTNYQIVINGKSSMFLDYKNDQEFFNGLRAILAKNSNDRNVLDALKNKPF